MIAKVQCICDYGDPGYSNKNACRRKERRDDHDSQTSRFYGDNSSRSTIVMSPDTFWTLSKATGFLGSGWDDREAEA